MPRKYARRGSDMAERLALYTAPPDANGCALWTGAKDSSGYGSVFWQGMARATHRLTWEMANGPIPVGMCVCHKCDIPACRTLDHMFLGTHLENMEDRDAKQRVFAKLTNREVIQAIANDYGVSRPLVSLIKSGKRRRQVVGCPV
jgi:hypothetical protein